MTRAGRRIAKSGPTPSKSALEWFRPRVDVIMSLQRGELSEAFAASLDLTAIRLDASMQPSVSGAVGPPCEGLLTYITGIFGLRGVHDKNATIQFVRP